jgi:PepSY-associated TM region
MKRWLFLAHRWLGIFGCLLIVLWFASGIVMMYMPYPSLGLEERMAQAAPIELARVRLSPLQALAATGRAEEASRLRLVQVDSRAVYAVLLPERGWVGVDAATGGVVEVTAADAVRAAEDFARVRATGHERLDTDQWTVPGGYNAHRPLLAVDMQGGARLYVSTRTGEVVQDTTRWERGWNWVGAVVHWVYPTALRSRPEAWHWVVIVLSGWALLTAVIGIAIGLLRLRRYARGRLTPYRGVMRWHHLLGLGSALFVTAWLLSGLLSMNPGSVFASRSPAADEMRAWRGGLTLASALARRADEPLAVPAGSKEVEWFADRGGALQVHRPAGASGPFVDAAFVSARAATLGLGPPVAVEWLDAPDGWYYQHGESVRPLPVWRVRFADARATWWHIDGRSGQPLGRMDNSIRAERWLYHGLHSWDWMPMLQNRPWAWDVPMLLALSLGLAFAFTSVVIAWRRLRRVPSSATSRGTSPLDATTPPLPRTVTPRSLS